MNLKMSHNRESDRNPLAAAETDGEYHIKRESAGGGHHPEVTCLLRTWHPSLKMTSE